MQLSSDASEEETARNLLQDFDTNLSEVENGHPIYVERATESITNSIDSDRVTETRKLKSTSTDNSNPTNKDPMNRIMPREQQASSAQGHSPTQGLQQHLFGKKIFTGNEYQISYTKWAERIGDKIQVLMCLQAVVEEPTLQQLQKLTRVSPQEKTARRYLHASVSLEQWDS
eukprot:Ihof_evm2s702 gene=Ihof_evmTU2s702